MNTFMNLVTRFLVKEETKGGIGVSGWIKVLIRALLLLILNFLARFWPASLSCFLIKLARKLIQKLRQVQNLVAIAKDGSLIITFASMLADPLGIELLEL